MKFSDKLLLRDYVQSKDRLHPPRIDSAALIVRWTKFIAACGLIVLAMWLLWQISGGAVQRWIGGY